MSEHLLNIREAAEYLGISERRLKELVDNGNIPAYKIGGSFLRFKKSQLAIVKASLYNTLKGELSNRKDSDSYSKIDSIKDFLYFNDFYIFSIVAIVLVVLLIIVT